MTWRTTVDDITPSKREDLADAFVQWPVKRLTISWVLSRDAYILYPTANAGEGGTTSFAKRDVKNGKHIDTGWADCKDIIFTD